jgi:hypothetical protein
VNQLSRFVLMITTKKERECKIQNAKYKKKTHRSAFRALFPHFAFCILNFALLHIFVVKRYGKTRQQRRRRAESVGGFDKSRRWHPHARVRSE